MLWELDAHFNRLYADEGCESAEPECLIRASLVQILYTICSKQKLMEQIRYNLLYRWFASLEIQHRVWNHATFSMNRERLLDEALTFRLSQSVLKNAQRNKLLS